MISDNDFLGRKGSLMTVVERTSGARYKVYDIKYNRAGYPHLLIYREGKWLLLSAKYFYPDD